MHKRTSNIFKNLGFGDEVISNIQKTTSKAKIPFNRRMISSLKKLGIPEDRVYYMPKKDNFWGPIGDTGPCGPDTEIFIDSGKEGCGDDCKPGCGCG